jgi:hypothetical protein
MSENGQDTPHEVDLHADRLKAAIQGITAPARDNVRQLMDKLTTLAKTISEKGEALENEVEEFRSVGRKLAEMTKVTVEPFDKLTEEFKVLSPKVVSSPASPPSLPKADPQFQARMPKADAQFQARTMEISPETQSMIDRFAGGRKPAKE